MSSLQSTVVAFVILCLAFSLAWSQDETISDLRLQELEKRCLEQQAQLQQLEKQLQEKMPENYTHSIVADYLQQPYAQEEEEAVLTGYEEGFFIRSSDGDMELKISGFLQTGVGFFETNSFDNNSFYAQGLYLMFDITMFEKFHIHIEADFADMGFYNQFQDNQGTDIITYDAYLEYMAADEFNILIGNVYVPFSMTGSHYYYANMTIWYEPFINTGGESSNPGIMIYGTLWDQLEYIVGVYNRGSWQLNQTDQPLYQATLHWYFLTAEKNPDAFVHAGFIYTRYVDDPSIDSRYATLYTGWGRQVFDGEDINPHSDQYGSPRANEALVRGRQWGFDLGLTWKHDFENGSEFRVESEAMYMNYNRELTTGKLAPLELWGFLIAAAYRYPICKDIEGSGIIPTLAFSYTDIDNKHTHGPTYPGGPAANIRGQRIWNYTIGLGYAFNKHFRLNFNWIIMDLEENAMNPAKDKPNVNQDLEHAWFLQATTCW